MRRSTMFTAFGWQNKHEPSLCRGDFIKLLQLEVPLQEAGVTLSVSAVSNSILLLIIFVSCTELSVLSAVILQRDSSSIRERRECHLL